MANYYICCPNMPPEARHDRNDPIFDINQCQCVVRRLAVKIEAHIQHIKRVNGMTFHPCMLARFVVSISSWFLSWFLSWSCGVFLVAFLRERRFVLLSLFLPPVVPARLCLARDNSRRARNEKIERTCLRPGVLLLS